MYNSEFIAGQTKHFANELRKTFIIFEDVKNTRNVKRRRIDEYSGEQCESSMDLCPQIESAQTFAEESIIEDRKYTRAQIKRRPQIQTASDIDELENDENNNNNESKCCKYNENVKVQNKPNPGVCCCLCSKKSQIQLHKSTSHIYDRRASFSNEINESTCKSCISKLVACSKMDTRSKKFECCFVQCNKLLQRGSLKRHYMSHLQIKEFKCIICDRQYTTKQSLVRHQRKH